MEKIKAKESIAIDPTKQSDSLSEKGMRIIDACSHFLGKMLLDGRVYVYCGRCKKFVLVHKH